MKAARDYYIFPASLLLLLVLCGCCASNGAEGTMAIENSDLSREMSRRGVSPRTVTRMELRNDESGGFGTFDIAPEDQDTIWRSITVAKPYDIWYASGYRRLEFYTSDPKSPALVLYVNESDACHLGGTKDPTERFRCLGLHEFLRQLSDHKSPRELEAAHP